MNTRALAMIGASIAIGMAAVFVAARWIAGQPAAATSKVVVAKTDLDAGTRLAPDMLQMLDWPSASALKGTFSDPKALEARVINSSLLQGEPVLEAKLAGLGSKGGLASVIAEGKRAMTVRVNEVAGVAGFAFPGNRVDVMVNTQDEQNRALSRIVLEQILVLAVAQQRNGDPTKPKIVDAVTLEVTPGQAEILDLARSVGSLSLVLRNQTDHALVETVGVGKSDLMGERDPRQPPRAQVPNPVVAKPEHLPPAPAPTQSTRTHAPRRGETTAIEIIRGMSRSSSEAQARPDGSG